MIVKNPDGSPAPGEVIEVKMTSNDWKNEYYWGKNFTTDTTGVVHFTITELEEDIGDYYINVSLNQQSFISTICMILIIN